MRKKSKRGPIVRIIIGWLLFFLYINFFSPEDKTVLIVFYIFLFASLFFTFRYFFSILRSIIWTGIIILFFILQQYRINNLINISLLLGLLLTTEIYFRKN